MIDNYRQYLDSISEVSLTTRDGRPLDITNIFTEFSIYESIFAHSLSGHIQLIDSHGLNNEFSFFGGEKLVISFHTRGKQSKDSLTFYVYKIGDVLPINDSSCSYRMYFTTEEAIANQRTRVSKHMEGNIDAMVESLLDIVGSQKSRDISKTGYIHDLIIPNMTPFGAINWLSKQAINPDTGNASYMFFETLDGYKFSSIEDLVQQEKKIKYTKTQVMSLNPDDPSYHDKMFKSVENEAFTDKFDIMKNYKNGVYSNRYLKHDILTKSYEYVDFDRDSVSTLDNPKTLYESYSYPLEGVVTIHSGRTEISNEKKNPQSRKSVINGLGQNIARIMVSGNSDLGAGDVIEYDYPSHGPMIEGKQPFDKYLRGNRIITGARHIVGKNGYTQVLELAKDSIKEGLND